MLHLRSTHYSIQLSKTEKVNSVTDPSLDWIGPTFLRHFSYLLGYGANQHGKYFLHQHRPQQQQQQNQQKQEKMENKIKQNKMANEIMRPIGALHITISKQAVDSFFVQPKVGDNVEQ